MTGFLFSVLWRNLFQQHKRESSDDQQQNQKSTNNINDRSLHSSSEGSDNSLDNEPVSSSGSGTHVSGDAGGGVPIIPVRPQHTMSKVKLHSLSMSKPPAWLIVHDSYFGHVSRFYYNSKNCVGALCFF